MYGYCKEKIDVGHYWDLQSYVGVHKAGCDCISKSLFSSDYRLSQSFEFFVMKQRTSRD